MTEELLRLPRVLAMTGRSSSDLYRQIKADKFLRPLKRGKSSLWPLSVVQKQIAEEIELLSESPRVS